MFTQNLYEDINTIKFIIQQIIYNIYVILNELDWYEDRFYNDFFKNKINEINFIIENNVNYYINDNIKYHRNNSILYMKMDNKLYWKTNNIYYCKNLSSNKCEIDFNNTFISLNDKLFQNNNLIKVLKGITNLLNYMLKFTSYVSYDNYNIIFINFKKNPYKVINVSKIFYNDNGIFFVKDLNEFITTNIITVQKFGLWLKYILEEFSSIKFNKLF